MPHRLQPLAPSHGRARPTGKWPVVLVTLAAVAGAWNTRIGAQTTAPASATPSAMTVAAATAIAPLPAATSASILADRVIGLANEVLAGNRSPRPDQWARARILLELAVGLQPDDPELWRSLIELYHALDEPAEHDRALARYVALAPDDDAAQWVIIRADLARRQTAEDRLAAADALIDGNPRGGLSPALRSRLSVLAARLARGIGDDPEADRRLAQAVRFDPSNIEAAEMVHRLTLERDASPIARAAALISRVRADPFSIEARLELADLLLAQAAYRHARRQYASASALTDRPFPPAVYYNWALCIAADGDPAQALRLLDALQLRLTPPDPEQPGIDTQTPASLAPLPLELEVIRLALHHQRRDAPAVQTTLAQVAASITSAASDDHQRRRAALTVAWLSAWMGADPAAVRSALERLTAEPAEPETNPLIERTRGWLLLSDGRADLARDILQPLAADDPFSALALARLLNGEERRRSLLEIIATAPASLAALAAAADLAESGVAPAPTAEGRRMLAMLGARTGDPTLELTPDLRWSSLELRVEPTTADILEPIVARVTVRNASPLPLSVSGPIAGPGILPNRVMLSLSTRIAGQAVGGGEAIIVDLGRRLRLNAGESITVPVRLHRTLWGRVLLERPNSTVNFDVTAVLDPRVASDGRVEQGPLGSSDLRATLGRRSVATGDAALDASLAMIRSSDATARMRALLTLASQLVEPPIVDIDNPVGLTTEVAARNRRISEAVNAASAVLSPVELAWAVAVAPGRPGQRAMLDRLHQRAQRSPDSLVRILYLERFVPAASDPAMTAAQRSDDPLLRRYAEALTAALAAASDNAPSVPIP